MTSLILGVGNPLRGDDGIGAAVIEWLRERSLPPHATAVDGGTAGLDLVSTLMGHQRAIIVDAADVKRAPGEWVRLTLDVARLQASELTLSLHAAGLADALALGAALGTLPAEIVIYGVQPARLDWTIGLSNQAQSAVPLVGRAILEEVEDYHGKNPDH